VIDALGEIRPLHQQLLFRSFLIAIHSAAVIGGGVLSVKKDLSIAADKIRTIFLDLKQ